MFFEKYTDKTDGVIRGFDVKSTRVKINCLAMAVCILCGCGNVSGFLGNGIRI